MTAPPTFTTFRFFRGTTFSTEPIVIDDENGDPVNLAGYTGTMEIWREDDNPAVDDPLFDTDGTLNLVITAGTGTVEGTIDAPDTLVDVDMDGEMWPCRITLTNTNDAPDTVERLISGYVIAQP